MRELTIAACEQVTGGFGDPEGEDDRFGDPRLPSIWPDIGGQDWYSLQDGGGENEGEPWYETAQEIGEGYMVVGTTIAGVAGAVVLAFPVPDPTDAAVPAAIAGALTGAVGGAIWLVGRAGEWAAN